MEIENRESFCIELNKYLCKNFECKVKEGYDDWEMGFAWCHSRIQIVADICEHYELYLRWVAEPVYDWNPNTLVIARIEFEEQRVGHGSRLLEFFCGQSDRFGIDYIGIECLNRNAYGFAEKLGFNRFGDDDDSYRTDNFFIEVDVLRKRLSDRRSLNKTG